MFGVPYLATEIYGFFLFATRNMYQQKHVRGYIGKLCDSTVRKSTTKHYFPARWHSPSLGHFVQDCLDEKI